MSVSSVTSDGLHTESGFNQRDDTSGAERDRSGTRRPLPPSNNAASHPPNLNTDMARLATGRAVDFPDVRAARADLPGGDAVLRPGRSRVGPSTTRVKRDDDPPETSSDAYADYVVRLGGQRPLDPARLDTLRWGVVRSMQNSHGMLADSYTADTMGNTILGALNRSPTFRAIASYSVNHGGEQLQDITYTDVYGLNPAFSGPFVRIRDMTADYLRAYDAGNMPVHLDPGAALRAPGRAPTVDIDAAPNAGSPYLPAWQAALIHELVHHLTGADDPPSNSRDRLGPTELLARRVAQEMGWTLPEFSGYRAPERGAYLERLSRAALLDTVQRNADHERQFFARLDTISGNEYASPDFHELEDEPFSAAPHNHTYALPAEQPQGGLGQLEFRYGEPLLFSFAHSATQGAPDGYDSARAATSASWKTQAGFFRWGKPTDGNPHIRTFRFPDGSRVVISAHEPQPASSDLGRFQQGMAVVGGAIAGGVGGAVTGGPVGVVLGGAAGAAAGAGVASTFPYDRIWQGYTLDYYYGKGDTTPSYTQSMYAWDSDWSRVGHLTAQKSAALWPDYADGDAEFWRWYSGNAPVRT